MNNKIYTQEQIDEFIANTDIQVLLRIAYGSIEELIGCITEQWFEVAREDGEDPEYCEDEDAESLTSALDVLANYIH